MTISIVLCFGDTLTSAGIEALLRNRDGLKVVDERPGARSALGAVRSRHPDVVLGDRDLAESPDVEEIAGLSKVIVVRGGDDPPEAMRWLGRGIAAVLGERPTPDALFAAIHVVANGSYLVVPPTLAPRLGNLSTERTAHASLTEREAEVLRLLAEGMSNVDIAKRLYVSDSTIRSHVHHVLRKLGVRSRTQAVSIAYRTGLLSPARAPRN